LCKQCGTELFSKEDQFDYGCGWPSFDDEIPNSVKKITDADGRRIEILCKKCDGQGQDLRPQYLSAIFYTSENQKIIAEKLIKILEEKGMKIDTKLLPAEKFWTAELYHQSYYTRNSKSPYCHRRVKRF
jgi:hypothetical protein